tara:strand:+ start:425 stop:652 length:228 start_codon:yes stop_codon:yes gene_type:complete
MLLAWEMKNPFKLLFNLFSSKEKKKPLTIEELRDLKLRKEKIEKAIKSRTYISEINQRYNKMSDRKRKNFFRKAS